VPAEARALFRRAVFCAGVGDAGDHPFSVDANHIEEICSAVIDFSIDQKVEWRPYDGEIVVDPDEWIVNAFFNLRLTGFTYELREGIEGHLCGLAVAHEHHCATGKRRRFNGHGIPLRHAIKHGMDGGKHGLLVRGLRKSVGCEVSCQKDAEKESEPLCVLIHGGHFNLSQEPESAFIERNCAGGGIFPCASTLVTDIFVSKQQGKGN
jgi:hypothetical protein